MMPSLIAAKSTTAGTPVKSCISTRAGRYAISREVWPPFSAQSEKAFISCKLTVLPSSKRNKFSKTTFKAAGSLEKSPNPALLAALME